MTCLIRLCKKKKSKCQTMQRDEIYTFFWKVSSPTWNWSARDYVYLIISNTFIFFSVSAGNKWCKRQFHFHTEFTTYLCYSPTCTPAQLSLLSEAIAKYSAFLEGIKKKTILSGHQNFLLFTLTQWKGWKKNAKIKHHSYGLWHDCVLFLTYRREVLVLTREEDDRMGKTRRKHDK